MAETEVEIPVLRPEITPQDERLINFEPLLRAFKLSRDRFVSLSEGIRTLGTLAIRNPRAAILAATTPLLATVIACSESEASPPDVRISVPEAQTPATESIKTVPTNPNQPTIIDSRTQEPAPTPETAIPAETPTQTSDESKGTTAQKSIEQAKPQSAWVVEVDPKLSSISPERIEEDKAIIQSVLEKFPQIGNLKIILTSGHVSQFKVETQEIILSRDYEHFKQAPEIFSFGLAHELFHYFDPELNGQALSAFLTEQQLVELKQLREQALSDPVWGRDYPDLEKIFTPAKNTIGHDLSLSRKYTEEQLAEWSDEYADATWLARTISNELSPANAFGRSLSTHFMLFRNYANEAAGIADISSMVEFLELPEVKSKVDPLAAKNPVLAKSLELIRQKGTLFAFENIVWPSTTPVQTRLQGKYLSNWWEALPNYIHSVLAEGVLENNPEVVNLFPPKDLGEIKSELKKLQDQADQEKLADLGVVTTMFGMRTSLSPLFEKLTTISQTP